jgi:hypothetical protein
MKLIRMGSLLSLLLLAAALPAVEGVKGTIVRPHQVEAKVKGCKVAKPGEYTATKGDLIELEYSYPVVPTATPKKVAYKVTLTGAVRPSPLGIRQVQSGLIGSHTLVFAFEAHQAGMDTVTLQIDDDAYDFKFKVEEKK